MYQAGEVDIWSPPTEPLWTSAMSGRRLTRAALAGTDRENGPDRHRHATSPFGPAPGSRACARLTAGSAHPRPAHFVYCSGSFRHRTLIRARRRPVNRRACAPAIDLAVSRATRSRAVYRIRRLWGLRRFPAARRGVASSPPPAKAAASARQYAAWRASICPGRRRTCRHRGDLSCHRADWLIRPRRVG